MIPRDNRLRLTLTVVEQVPALKAKERHGGGGIAHQCAHGGWDSAECVPLSYMMAARGHLSSLCSVDAQPTTADEACIATQAGRTVDTKDSVCLRLNVNVRQVLNMV